MVNMLFWVENAFYLFTLAITKRTVATLKNELPFEILVLSSWNLLGLCFPNPTYPLGLGLNATSLKVPEIPVEVRSS